MYSIKLTENQAEIILRALYNESIGDAVERGEYSYYRCALDIEKKLKKGKL